MSSLASALQSAGPFGLPPVEGLTFGPYTVERQLGRDAMGVVLLARDARAEKSVALNTIERPLGRGAMGVVLLARDPRAEKSVALKVLLPLGGADELKRKRLLREATLPAGLDHPGIVSILDSGTIDGLPFLALEFVEGETLEAEMKRGLLSPARATGVNPATTFLKASRGRRVGGGNADRRVPAAA